MPPLTGDGRPSYWRSLEELKGLAAPAGLREFAPDFWGRALSRRDFLKFMAASAALAGLSACRRPADRILPADERPEDLVPGKPLFFASALALGGYARGVLVESHEGRPTKIEGNPDHPDSLGATDVFMQAAILDLYDPDRSQSVEENGVPSSWEACAAALEAAARGLRASRGAGLRLLTGPTTSPAFEAQLARLRRELPELRWHVHDPAGRRDAAGTVEAFGTDLSFSLDLRAADVLVSLDADPLCGEPGSLACGAAFGDRRDPSGARPPLRIYAAETGVSLLGASADHRLPVKPSRLHAVAAALARELGVHAEGPEPRGDEAAWVKAAARDLRRAGPAGAVAVGPRRPAELQALGHALNARLGAVGKTVIYRDRVLLGPADPAESFAELCRDLRAGRVSVLLTLDCNPAYSGAAGDGFAEAAARAPFSLHLGTHRDETALASRWHVPLAHPLETWTDARAFDGTATVAQPLIAPLYDGLGIHEVLAALEGRPASSHDVVRAHWGDRGLDVAGWDAALRAGVVSKTAFAPRLPRLRPGFAPAPAPTAREVLEVAYRPSPAVWDGARANNGWLQELPDPITKTTWGDGARLAPALAEKMGLRDGDEVALTLEGRSLKLPALVVPGHADGAVTVSLGYGRAAAGRVGDGIGASAYMLRRGDSDWDAHGLKLERTGRRTPLPGTQGAQDMAGRDLIRAASYAAFLKTPGFAKEEADRKEPDTLYRPAPPMDGEHAWGMSVDLSRCMGCSSCVVACQAENNVPVVGPEEVARGRHMHWLRVDRYFSGEADHPSAAFQPVPCMHCEHAPCEEVCPVGATVHSPEGLNEMIYNRCVGTRYCSNNCPYKVRRFNFFDYSDAREPVKLARNPDVTVRERGVMEKCTYCVQRIQRVRLDAEKENRAVADGEVVTACQAACPSHAIVFGDLNDPKSRAARLRADPRTYALLGELGTRPRTTYLARVTNPSEEAPAS